jgi:hypothetical protein
LPAAQMSPQSTRIRRPQRRPVSRLALLTALRQGDRDREERVVIKLHRSLKAPKQRFDDPEIRERSQRTLGELRFELLSGCNSTGMLGLIRDLGSRVEPLHRK